MIFRRTRPQRCLRSSPYLKDQPKALEHHVVSRRKMPSSQRAGNWTRNFLGAFEVPGRQVSTNVNTLFVLRFLELFEQAISAFL
jgi:hypothetical protein